MTPTPGIWTWLGRTPFGRATELQERLRSDVLAGKRSDTLLLLEHDPVITLGRSANPEHVVAPLAELANRGIDVVHTSRGGDVTYHGPGQLVGYPIFRLRGNVLAHVEAMARAVIELLAEQQIAAEWRRERPGVWVGRDKICAFGINIRRRVAIHGLALNVSLALDAFDAVVPCGLRGSGVTSIARLRGSAPTLGVLAPRMAAALARSFALPLTEVSPDAVLGLHSSSGPIE